METEERMMARYLRLGVVRQVCLDGRISESDALEILRGCLSPGEEETRVDDSALLHASREEIESVFGKSGGMDE